MGWFTVHNTVEPQKGRKLTTHRSVRCNKTSTEWLQRWIVLIL